MVYTFNLTEILAIITLAGLMGLFIGGRFMAFFIKRSLRSKIVYSTGELNQFLLSLAEEVSLTYVDIDKTYKTRRELTDYCLFYLNLLRPNLLF